MLKGNLVEKQSENCCNVPRNIIGISEMLRHNLGGAFKKMGVRESERERIYSYINALAKKDVKTAEHSIRVGLLCMNLAYELGLDAKGLAYPGFLHDVGKKMIDSEILKKTNDFTKEDMNIIKKHPLYTFWSIVSPFRFSAHVALRHHMYQKHGYPLQMPDINYHLSDKAWEDIMLYAAVLSIVDFFDAAISRQDRKFNVENNELSFKEVFAQMEDNSMIDKEFIWDISKCGVFKDHYDFVRYSKNSDQKTIFCMA